MATDGKMLDVPLKLLNGIIRDIILKNNRATKGQLTTMLPNWQLSFISSYCSGFRCHCRQSFSVQILCSSIECLSVLRYGINHSLKCYLEFNATGQWQTTGYAGWQIFQFNSISSHVSHFKYIMGKEKKWQFGGKCASKYIKLLGIASSGSTIIILIIIIFIFIIFAKKRRKKDQSERNI